MADSVLTVVEAVAGVEVQTEIGWQEANRANLPKTIMINKMDRENANFNRVVQQVKDVLKCNAVPVQLPIGSEAAFAGVIDLLAMKAYRYNSKDGSYQEQEIPEDLLGAAQEAQQNLMEAAAEGDDELLMRYLDGETLTGEEIFTGLKKAFQAQSMVPVLCGSSLNNIGIRHLLDFIVTVAPSPADLAEPDAKLNGEPLAVLIYKTMADPYVGKVSFFRVFSGVLKSDNQVYNANKEKEEKIAQLFVMRGKQQKTSPKSSPATWLRWPSCRRPRQVIPCAERTRR